MAKDFSNFLGPKKKKNINLTKKSVKTSGDHPNKTENKVSTNLVQTENSSISELSTNLVQTKNKVSTEKLEKKQSEYKVSTELSTLSSTNLVQTKNKVSTKLDFSALVGLQKKLLILVYFSIRRNQFNQTEKLSVEYLAQSSKSTKYSVRQSIQRLEKKGFINRENFKNGRGGWTVYSIPKSIFQDLLQAETENKVSTNLVQTENKVSTELSTKLSTSPHSSSKIKSLKSTTTIDDVDNFLLKHNILIPDELDKVGFRESHLKQILQVTSLSCEEIEESLNHYALDLRNGSVRAGFGKLNLIVGVLKKSNLYVSEAYIAEEQNMLNELANRSQKLKELKNKQAEISLLKKYKAWKLNLDQDEINKLVPPNNIIEEGGTLQDIQLQSYFQENYADIVD